MFPKISASYSFQLRELKIYVTCTIIQFKFFLYWIIFKNYDTRTEEQPIFVVVVTLHEHIRNLRCFCYALFVVSLFQDLIKIHTPRSQYNNSEL
jgi:hypothetical protein